MCRISKKEKKFTKKIARNYANKMDTFEAIFDLHNELQTSKNRIFFDKIFCFFYEIVREEKTQKNCHIDTQKI